jgi:hypothetical protein
MWKYLKWFLILSAIGGASDAYNRAQKVEQRQVKLENFLRTHGYPLLPNYDDHYLQLGRD